MSSPPSVRCLFDHGAQRFGFVSLEQRRGAELRRTAMSCPIQVPPAASHIGRATRALRPSGIVVAGGIGFPTTVSAAVTGGKHLAAANEAGATPDQSGRGANGAALSDDDGLAVGGEIPACQPASAPSARGYRAGRRPPATCPVTRLNRLFTVMPWMRGSVPVPIVAWPTPVTVGSRLDRASVNQAPSRRRRVSVGITSAY